jgi:hypothetical protein
MLVWKLEVKMDGQDLRRKLISVAKLRDHPTTSPTIKKLAGEKWEKLRLQLTEQHIGQQGPLRLSHSPEAKAGWSSFECESCGDDIPMPEGMTRELRHLSRAGQEIICSTCQAKRFQQWREKKERENHLPMAGVKFEECDFCPEPVRCIGECWRLSYEVPTKADRKTNLKQGKLF